jgi:hypothetical protein
MLATAKNKPPTWPWGLTSPHCFLQQRGLYALMQKDQLSASISLIQPDPNLANQHSLSGEAHLWNAAVPLLEWHVIKISLGTNLRKLCAESRDCEGLLGVLLFANELDQKSRAKHENTASAPTSCLPPPAPRDAVLGMGTPWPAPPDSSPPGYKLLVTQEG